MATQERKWIVQSKTMWGIVIMALPTIFQMFGWDMTAEESGAIANAGTHFIQGAGAVLAIIGRLTAKGPAVIAPGSANV